MDSSSYSIINLIILLKVTTLPWENMNVNMRYSLSCLGPILQHNITLYSVCPEEYELWKKVLSSIFTISQHFKILKTALYLSKSTFHPPKTHLKSTLKLLKLISWTTIHRASKISERWKAWQGSRQTKGHPAEYAPKEKYNSNNKGIHIWKKSSCTYLRSSLLELQVWVMKLHGTTQVDDQPAEQPAIDHKSRQQWDPQSAELHALGRQARVQNVKSNKIWELNKLSYNFTCNPMRT